MIKVSVVVPVYNTEKYLRQCVDSIIGQTLREIEIILVNDASTDGSLEICRQYQNADNRVTVVDKDINKGLAAARNTGMALCHGEFIGFVDSDDWIEPDMYEQMYSAASGNGADIAFCNCMENEDGHRFSKFMRCGFFDREQIEKEILPRTLAGISKKGGKDVIRWSNCLRIFRRSVIADCNIRFDDRFRRCQDLQLTYEVTLRAKGFCYLGDSYFYHNRTTEGSLSRGYTNNMWTLIRPLIQRLYNDTYEFPDLELSDRMHLCAFFFIGDIVQNELRDSSPFDKAGKISNIADIFDDEICKGCLPFIEKEKLNEYYEGLYDYAKAADAAGFYRFHFLYLKRKRAAEKRKAFFSSLTEGKVTGRIYVGVRRLLNKNYKPKARSES